MSGIPLHLQRKFEQRWAARFVLPVAAAAPENTVLKESVDTLPPATKARDKPAELSRGP
jgi:hypothetical protein